MLHVTAKKLPGKKLVSLLTSATLTAGLLASPTALGLGLGNPAVESYIGEPLRVRIPISAASEAELEALQVRLAGADWYLQAGIERDPVVDTLLVGIERSGDGANVVITSPDGLNQVMLPLLLALVTPFAFAADEEKPEPGFNEATFKGLEFRSIGPALMSGRV